MDLPGLHRDDQAQPKCSFHPYNRYKIPLVVCPRTVNSKVDGDIRFLAPSQQGHASALIHKGFHIKLARDGCWCVPCGQHYPYRQGQRCINAKIAVTIRTPPAYNHTPLIGNILDVQKSECPWLNEDPPQSLVADAVPGIPIGACRLSEITVGTSHCTEQNLLADHDAYIMKEPKALCSKR